MEEILLSPDALGGEVLSMQSSTETWFSVRDGEYFCDDCNEQLVAHSVRELFVLREPLEEMVYTCGSCGRRVIIPYPRRVFNGRS